MFSRPSMLALVLSAIAVAASPALHVHISAPSTEDLKVIIDSGDKPLRISEDFNNLPFGFPTDHSTLNNGHASSHGPAARPAFNIPLRDCTPEEMKQVLLAANAAQVLVERSNFDLARTGDQGAGYITWFGQGSPARLEKVVTTFGRLAQNTFKEFRYRYGGKDCDTPDVIAWVTPSEFGEINLCPRFFDKELPVAGQRQSRASMIIHESTHFVENGALEDHLHLSEGGRAGLQDLALRMPDWAVTNAANYEMFAATAIGREPRPSGPPSQAVLFAIAQSEAGEGQL